MEPISQTARAELPVIPPSDAPLTDVEKHRLETDLPELQANPEIPIEQRIGNLRVVEGSVFESYDTLIKVVKLCPHLKILRLRILHGDSEKNQRNWKEVFSFTKELEEFALGHITNMYVSEDVAPVIEGIKEHCPKLTKLHFRHLIIREQSLASLDLLTQLEELSLISIKFHTKQSDHDPLRDKQIKPLKSLKKLRVVCLIGNDYLTKEVFSRVRSKCLESIDVRGCNIKFKDAVNTALDHRYPRLKKLYVSKEKDSLSAEKKLLMSNLDVVFVNGMPSLTQKNLRDYQDILNRITKLSNQGSQEQQEVKSAYIRQVREEELKSPTYPREIGGEIVLEGLDLLATEVDSERIKKEFPEAKVRAVTLGTGMSAYTLSQENLNASWDYVKCKIVKGMPQGTVGSEQVYSTHSLHAGWALYNLFVNDFERINELRAIIPLEVIQKVVHEIFKCNDILSVDFLDHLDTQFHMTKALYAIDGNLKKAVRSNKKKVLGDFPKIAYEIDEAAKQIRLFVK